MADGWLFVPLKAWSSVIIGAWRTLTEINFVGCGFDVLPFGETGENEFWWSFCMVTSVDTRKGSRRGWISRKECDDLLRNGVDWNEGKSRSTGFWISSLMSNKMRNRESWSKKEDVITLMDDCDYLLCSLM